MASLDVLESDKLGVGMGVGGGLGGSVAQLSPTEPCKLSSLHHGKCPSCLEFVKHCCKCLCSSHDSENIQT